jgi:mannitol-1-phosphate/altronate dehydrogenase
MKITALLSTAVLALSFCLTAAADSRPDHFAAKQSETLAQAVSNFSEYNSKLEQLLSQDTLTPEDLNHIHQLTYTLEAALEKIHNELAELAEVLEEVHVASESFDAKTVQKRGKAYLETSRQVIP